MAKYSITTPTARKNLTPRREPYWVRVTKGRFIGFRRLAAGGTWQVKYNRTVKSIGTDKTYDYKQALEQVNLFCDALEGGACISYTLKQSINDYMDNRAIKRGEKGVEADRLRTLNMLPEELLDTPVASLTTSQLTQWCNDHERCGVLGKPLTKATVKRDWVRINAALEFALRQGRVNDNTAWARVERYSAKVDKARNVFFTEDQIKIILEKAQPHARTYFKANLLLGSRIGEPADLQVKHFDLEKRTILFGRKVGLRTTHLSDAAYSFLLENSEGKAQDDYIFMTSAGEQWQAYEWGRAFRLVRPYIELPEDANSEAVGYCFRHFYISRALQTSMPLVALARNCGTSVAQIEKTYGHFMPTDLRGMLNDIDLGAL